MKGARRRSTECGHVFLPEAAPVDQESGRGLWEAYARKNERKESGNYCEASSVTDCTHRSLPRPVLTGLGRYLFVTDTSSTSKFSVAFGGIKPLPAPRAP